MLYQVYLILLMILWGGIKMHRTHLNNNVGDFLVFRNTYLRDYEIVGSFDFHRTDIQIYG